MKNALSIAVICIAALAGFGVYTFLNATPPRDFARGIDVSHHQGDIDWRALATTDIRFVYIKASEGADYVDPNFSANWQGAGEAGLMRGAYHYFTLCRPGAAQAEHFVATVPATPDMLPPAVDLEHMGPCRQGPAAADVGVEARAFIDAVAAHYGVRPVLYTTQEFHDAHLAAFRGERFWIRSLWARPGFRTDEWVFWQNDNRGRRAGVSGPVDLDVFRGTEAALRRFAGGEQSP